MIAPQTLLALAGAAYLLGKYVRQRAHKPVRERPSEHAFAVADESPLYAAEPLAYPHPDFAAARALALRDLTEYIEARVRYPDAAKKHGVEGTAIVVFDVETDGTLSAPRLLRDPGHGLGAAALDAVRHLHRHGHRWRPAYRDGQAVRYHYTLPVKVKPEITPPLLS